MFVKPQIKAFIVVTHFNHDCFQAQRLHKLARGQVWEHKGQRHCKNAGQGEMGLDFKPESQLLMLKI